jgi:anti-anti-sigma factor
MLQQVADISIFGPAGELDSHDGGILIRKIEELFRREWSKIVLDLRDVEHIHFRFLGDLVSLAKSSSVLSGGIKLANLSPYTREILRLAGVGDFLETYDSVAEAILSFPSRPPCEMN